MTSLVGFLNNKTNGILLAWKIINCHDQDAVIASMRPQPVVMVMVPVNSTERREGMSETGEEKSAGKDGGVMIPSLRSRTFIRDDLSSVLKDHVI